jgi:hypothetical protein
MTVLPWLLRSYAKPVRGPKLFLSLGKSDVWGNSGLPIWGSGSFS